MLTFAFMLSSLPCLYTFWHAIPTSFHFLYYLLSRVHQPHREEGNELVNSKIPPNEIIICGSPEEKSNIILLHISSASQSLMRCSAELLLRVGLIHAM